MFAVVYNYITIGAYKLCWFRKKIALFMAKGHSRKIGLKVVLSILLAFLCTECTL